MQEISIEDYSYSKSNILDIHNSVGIKLLTPIRINKLAGNYKFIDKAIIENSDLTLDDYVYIEGNVEFINCNIDSTELLTNGIISIIVCRRSCSCIL